MTDGETKTAYEQFLEQAQEEIVHQERNETGEFLGYRDIANDLFAIAKRESLPYLTNRFQLFSTLALILALIGHGVIFLNFSTLRSNLNENQNQARAKISGLEGLTSDQRDEFTNQSESQLAGGTAPINGTLFILQFVLLIGTIWIAFSGFLACKEVSEKNSDRNIFIAAASATHNFLLWKLRSPTNATVYSVFVDFDQLESDDIDFEQLKHMFSNAHHSWNRRGMFDFVWMALVAIPVLLIPAFGLGIYFWTVGLAFSFAVRRHLQFIGPYDCLHQLPSPIAAPYPQNKMAKSDGEDGYPG